MPALRIPELVRRRARAQGAPGRAWIDALPGLAADLARRWDLTLGDAFGGGTSGVVLEATDASGRPYALKLAMPLTTDDDDDTFARCVLVHQLASGGGCAELYRHDLEARALLLERLGPTLADLGMPLPMMLRSIADTLAVFWRTVDRPVALPTGADKAAWLSAYITATWERLGRPCDRAVIGHALDCCERRTAAFDPSTAVLVHGDAHGWNALAAGGGTYKFVDAEGLLSEPAHDLAVPMREYNEALLAGDTLLLARARARNLARRCGVDATAVWEWGYVERVSTGLSSAEAFGADAGTPFFTVAERCLPRGQRAARTLPRTEQSYFG